MAPVPCPYCGSGEAESRVLGAQEVPEFAAGKSRQRSPRQPIGSSANRAYWFPVILVSKYLTMGDPLGIGCAMSWTR